MEKTTISMGQATIEKIEKIDGSIMHWSIRLGQAMAAVRKVEAQLANLYQFRDALLLKDLESQGVSVKNCSVSTDGSSITVTPVEHPNGDPSPLGG